MQNPEICFGRAIREVRIKRGLSQEHLAFGAGLHRTFISDIERGKRNPTVQTVWRLAQALSTNPSVIFAIAEQGQLFDASAEPVF